MSCAPPFYWCVDSTWLVRQALHNHNFLARFRAYPGHNTPNKSRRARDRRTRAFVDHREVP